MVMQMSRQQKSCAHSVYAEKLLERQWVRDRCLAGRIATHVGRRASVLALALYRSSILQQRDLGTFRTGRSQGHGLKWPIAIAHNAQQALRVNALRFTDDGNLSWLRKGIHQRLEPLAKAQRILGHHALYLGQRLVSDIDITQLMSLASPAFHVRSSWDPECSGRPSPA